MPDGNSTRYQGSAHGGVRSEWASKRQFGWYRRRMFPLSQQKLLGQGIFYCRGNVEGAAAKGGSKRALARRRTAATASVESGLQGPEKKGERGMNVRAAGVLPVFRWRGETPDRKHPKPIFEED